MPSLVETARRTIRKYGLIPPGSRVLVALSGGPDSVALLLVLSELARGSEASDAGPNVNTATRAIADGCFVLAGVAHLNHQLRGQEADEDEKFCRSLASKMSFSIDVERVDVARKAVESGTSVEQAAHAERYAFFERAARHLGATAVAVGHTRNDQAESHLLRLVRGAGPRGLAGIHPRVGIVIRPLIEASREDVRAFLNQHGVEFREDTTNTDVTIVRNRVRHELIPFLEQRFSRAIVDVLAREAAIARDDAAFLESAAAEAAARLVARNATGGAEIDIRALMAEPAAVARRVVRDAQTVAAGGRFVGFEAVEAVMALAVSNASGPLDLPGHRVNRRGGKLVLIPGAGRSPRPQAHSFSYVLDVPGCVDVPEAACAISAEPARVPPGRSAGSVWPLVARGSEVIVEASQLTSPLMVRSRRPGDAFRPLGLRGRKKLQDFFVDEKVQRGMRDTVPLVVDSQGRIVWVAGHALAEEFRVTDRTEAVIILRQEPI